MHDLKYRYFGPMFNDIRLILDTYKEEYFVPELEMESNLFFDLRKKNDIKPFKIIDSSDEEKNEIKEFFLKYQESFFFLIINNNIIGSIMILDNYIQSLCINKEYQRQGYGEKLVKHAVNYIKQHNFEYVELNIMDGNIAADKLYMKIGFQKVE